MDGLVYLFGLSASTTEYKGEIQIFINDARWDQWELSIINLLDLHWYALYIAVYQSTALHCTHNKSCL